MTARLVLTDIACIRGGRMLFEHFNLALHPGDAALVTGANGAGKSSLIRLAAGLLAPAAGTVEQVGRVALMAEDTGLDPERTLADALGFWARIDDQPLGDALARVGLGDLANVPVRLLSTGQRRRAALARVIASDAAIWLLDEPSNGLDGQSVAMLEALVDDHRQAGGIVVVATHLPLTIPQACEVRL